MIGHPLVWVMALIVLLIIIWFVTMRAVNQNYKPGQTFSEYSNQIKVTSSDMTFVSAGSKDVRAIILGKVRNNSQVTWQEISFQVEFLDKDGKMIDNLSMVLPNLTVQPEADAAFKIQYGLTMPLEQYAKDKVTVNNAKEANSSP